MFRVPIPKAGVATAAIVFPKPIASSALLACGLVPMAAPTSVSAEAAS